MLQARCTKRKAHLSSLSCAILQGLAYELTRLAVGLVAAEIVKRLALLLSVPSVWSAATSSSLHSNFMGSQNYHFRFGLQPRGLQLSKVSWLEALTGGSFACG